MSAAGPQRIAALVLAGGNSRRLGEPKQIARVGEETLLDRAVRVAHEAGLSPVLVVLGAGAEQVRARCQCADVEWLVNRGWAEGMGSSLRCGAEALAGRMDLRGVVVMTCDMPGVSAEHLRLVQGRGAEVRASGYADRAGVPAYFPSEMLQQLQRLQGDAGARELLQGVPVVALAGAELDVDTPEQLVRARELFGGRRIARPERSASPDDDLGQ